MKNLKGSNQFESKHGLPNSTTGSVIWLLSIVAPLVIVLGVATQIAKQNHTTVVPQANAQVATPSATLTPTPTINPYSQENIEAYIRTIFGKDARVAIAIQHDECNPSRKDYPSDCILHTNAEYSVGLFQINLFNKSHWIHAQKIPGETMEAKIEWLKNPYNNTLMAYKIFKDSGFYPWTTYKNGGYLRNL